MIGFDIGLRWGKKKCINRIIGVRKCRIFLVKYAIIFQFSRRLFHLLNFEMKWNVSENYVKYKATIGIYFIKERYIGKISLNFIGFEIV